jgi:tetratricopeptide (TPR) repeat protein
VREIDQDTVWALEAVVTAATQSPMPVSDAEALLSGLMTELGVRPTVRAELLVGQAFLAMLGGDAGRAYELYEQSNQIERDLGRHPAWRAAGFEGWLFALEGRFEEARLRLGEYQDGLMADGYDRLAVAHAATLALVESRSGHLTAAREHAQMALHDTSVEYEAATLASMALCEVALAEGDTASAIAQGQRAVAVASGGDWVPLIVDARQTLARALGAAGDTAGAAAELAAADALAAAKELAMPAYTPASQPQEETDDG